MNKATNHLLSNLTEREKLEAERKAYQALEDQELDRKRIREKVLKFGQDAIKGDASCDMCVVSTLILMWLDPLYNIIIGMVNYCTPMYYRCIS